MPISPGTWWTPRQAENPLRRPVDRNQHRAVTTLVLAAVLLIPALSWLAGAGTYRWNAAVERAEQLSRHRVTATLLGDATLHSSGRPYLVATLADASWTAPDGLRRTGEITTRYGTPAGSTQQLWIDDTGAPATAPQTPGQTLVAVLVTTALTALVAGSLLALAGCLLGRRYDRQRSALWDAEWARMDEQHPV